MATTCAKSLVSVWIPRFGIPLDMTSDRGTQFSYAIWNNVAYLLGVQLHRTTAYQPQTNGLVERFHRTVKTSPKARLTGPNWIDELPWVLLGIWTDHKQNLHASSAELVYGEPLTVHWSFVTANTIPWSPLEQLRLPNVVPTLFHSHIKVSIPDEMLSEKYVFVRHDGHRTPLQRPYDKPYEAILPGSKHSVSDLVIERKLSLLIA